MWWKRKPWDFKAEIDAHLQLEADELRSEGLSPTEAQAAARRALGNRTAAEEKFYESSRWMLITHVVRDVRYAARVLRKDAKFSLLAVVGLALGIGISTGIFALVYAVARLETANVRDPATYVGLNRRAQDSDLSYPEYRYYREHAAAFQEMSAESGRWTFVLGPISTSGEPEVVEARFEAGNFLSVLGRQPALGRSFSEDEEKSGSYQSRF